MPVEQVRHYIRRATDFLDSMELMRADEPFQNSSALLAIHSAISFSDALRVGLGDRTLAADDHRKAADTLQQILASKRLEDQAGYKHLRYLLAWKSLVTYGDQRLESTDYETLFTRAERFARWAGEVAKQLKIEGWQDDDQ